jgi:histidine triad (HIT) family protein
MGLQRDIKENEMDCIFCNIVGGEVDADIVFEDEKVVVFNDLYPKAPHHLLIIPRRHIATLNDIEKRDEELMGHIIYIAKKQAERLGIAEQGYRLLLNCNQEGGQVIYHMHFHLLGGRLMTWPPG